VRPFPHVRGWRGRVAAAAERTVDDAVAAEPDRGGGLLAGSWTAGSCLTIRRMSDVSGVAISGRWCPGRGFRVRVNGPGRLDGNLTFASGGRVAGRLGGRRVAARRAGAPAGTGLLELLLEIFAARAAGVRGAGARAELPPVGLRHLAQAPRLDLVDEPAHGILAG
jgi:hypothetical protein